jgi:ketosteroid isomerase-like protein
MSRRDTGPVSEANVEKVQRALDAFTRRDKAGWFELCDPNIELAPTEDWPETDRIRGREAAWDFLVASDEPWEPSPYEVAEVAHGEDAVAARLRREMRGKSSGAAVEYDYWFVLQFRDGVVLRGSWFADRDRALEAAGLQDD